MRLARVLTVFPSVLYALRGGTVKKIFWFDVSREVKSQRGEQIGISEEAVKRAGHAFHRLCDMYCCILRGNFVFLVSEVSNYY